MSEIIYGVTIFLAIQFVLVTIAYRGNLDILAGHLRKCFDVSSHASSHAQQADS